MRSVRPALWMNRVGDILTPNLCFPAPPRRPGRRAHGAAPAPGLRASANYLDTRLAADAARTRPTSRLPPSSAMPAVFFCGVLELVEQYHLSVQGQLVQPRSPALGSAFGKPHTVCKVARFFSICCVLYVRLLFMFWLAGVLPHVVVLFGVVETFAYKAF